MATDDLNAPLGQGKSRKKPRALPVKVSHVIVGALSLLVATFAAWAMFVDDPFGGEPVAVVRATLRTDVAEAKPSPGGAPPAAERPVNVESPATEPASPVVTSPPPGTKTVTIIDGTSGRRQDVLIPATTRESNGPTLAGKTSTLDDRLSEPGRHGPLPKVAQDGARPTDVFARAVKPIPGKPNAPRVAIVVGGLGIGTTGTNDALRKLPEAITLAFAPYGTDLERQAARARDGGHEFLLQVPMEPFDYPDNDPGPQTLLTTLDAGQNVDRLHWLMSRFQGYVGIANYMGARFVASEQSLAPVLRETAKRGLIYVDDGSVPRSLASQIAGANNVAFAKADLIIDSVTTPADVDRALGRLETLARERGTAVGVANALPVSIERIAKWAQAAQGRGILLVPITAVVAKAKSS
jgi:polysaccharide deacetylase 2 family uncharacterized protein YibQ